MKLFSFLLLVTILNVIGGTTFSRDTSLNLDNEENFLVLQQKRVAGTVVDKNGIPSPGVNVLVTGTTIGTMTDASGKYSIDVPSGAKSLTFSFIGMESQEVTIGTSTQIDITMTESAVSLDEVVVIGYGTAKRSEVTGSVGVTSGSDLQGHVSFNPLSSLRGKIAGVEIFTNSGSAFGDPRVTIRGVGTINASSQPLYVVDGVQTTDIKYMNVNDIVSIEVLKDASSAAIYGARGANGVILITTMKGGEKEGLTVEFSSKAMFDRIYKRHNSLYNPMNSEEFMTVQRIGFENAPYFKDYPEGQEPKLILNNDQLFDSQGNPLYDTNWEDEVTRLAFSNDQQLNIQARSKNTSYGFFLNYLDRQEIMINSFAKRANARFFHEISPKKWVTMSTNLSINRTWEQIGLNSGWSMARLIHEMPPIFPVKWPDGTYSDASQTTGTNMGFETLANPVSALVEYQRPVDRTQLFGDVSFTFHIASNLNLVSRFGINNVITEAKTYAPKWLRYGSGFPSGRASISNSTGTFWQNENYLEYNKQFGLHNLKLMGGASWQQNISSNNASSVYNYPDDMYSYYYINAASNYGHPTSSYSDWTMNSFFARGTYNYNNKYTITITGRSDGSSRFGENNKYAFFPSGGFSWLISNEDFMSGIKFIDRLRLRTSYGITGNTEIGLYGSLATIGAGTTLMDGVLNSTSYVARLSNPDLEWEKTSQFDVGFELDILNHRVSLEADYYYKYTTDLLLARPVPETTGFSSISDNIGEVSNKGIEMLITTRNIVSSSFNWTSTLTFSHNKNRIEKLGAENEDIFPGPVLHGSLTILRVGEPVNSFWGLTRVGTYGSDEAEEAAAAGLTVGEKKWASTDKGIIGCGLPTLRGSFINNIEFGKFDLLIDLQFNYGNDIYQAFSCTSEDRVGLMNGLKTELYNAWTPDNQNTMQSKIRHYNLNGANRNDDSYWICDGSYLRGNLFSVGYSFGQNLLNKLGLSYLRLSAAIENAFVIYSKDFRGYDPESAGLSVSGNNFDQNIYWHTYPKSTTYSLSCKIRF